MVNKTNKNVKSKCKYNDNMIEKLELLKNQTGINIISLVDKKKKISRKKKKSKSKIRNKKGRKPKIIVPKQKEFNIEQNEENMENNELNENFVQPIFGRRISKNTNIKNNVGPFMDSRYEKFISFWTQRDPKAPRSNDGECYVRCGITKI